MAPNASRVTTPAEDWVLSADRPCGVTPGMAMLNRQRLRWASVAACAVLLLGIPTRGQDSQPIIPPNATALEGLPSLRMETTPDGTTRHRLDEAEAAANRLRVQIRDGSFYWSSRDDRRLALTGSGDFTYLSSAAPGQYVRIRRLNDRLTYVEHIDTALGSVTFSGELRVVIGK